MLGKLGRYSEAKQAAEKAIALGGPWHDTAMDTLQSIEVAEHKTTP
ncbi:MAG: hypothetical protein KGK17_09515 [Betaproteobacteria bacterium]|nr:hypothetical protein [Betaproteobacteria bacterium]